MDLKEIVRRDVAAGVYDKWYRYNHKDGGEEYNRLWMDEYRKNPPELKIMFIEMDHTYFF